MKAGFIGTGSMGSILIEAFIQSGALKPADVVAANRTFEKAKRLSDKYPGMQAVRTIDEVVPNSEMIFLCIKPMEYKLVVDHIRQQIRPEQTVVIITSPVQIRHLEKLVPCKVIKMIPSVTNSVFSGVTLCMYGSRTAESDRIEFEQLLGHFSVPIRIAEEHTRVTSDLSSCGPAFLAFFIQKFIDAAVEETGIPRDQATLLASGMALGTGKLLTEGGYTPASLQAKVSVPGGITAEALRMMAGDLDGMFNRLIRTTHAKYAEDLEKLEAQFS